MGEPERDGAMSPERGAPLGEHGLRLLSVHEIIEADSTAHYHLAVGYQRGSPWRFDSVYLRAAAFELVDPPFRTLPWFVPHGVSVVRHEQMPALARGLDAFAGRLASARSPGALYGERAAFKPGLDAFASWDAARDGVQLLLRQLQEWTRTVALDGHGLSIYPPGR